jgi:hypothetical protein
MKEPYESGVANRFSAPSHAPGHRKGPGEALTGGDAGRAIEPRNVWIWGADAVSYVEGNTWGTASARLSQDPTGSMNHGTYLNSLCGNREIPRPALDGVRARVENPKGTRRR